MHVEYNAEAGHALLQDIIETLNKKYLFAEMIEKPSTAAAREYYDILKRAMKSMTEHVSEAERKQTDNHSFIRKTFFHLKYHDIPLKNRV